MPFFLGARRLSQLVVDVDKDWQAKSITNLGDLGWNDAVLGRLAADILGLNAGDSFRVPADGQLQFGADTNLYRSAADSLRTDNNLQITKNLYLVFFGTHIYFGGSGAFTNNILYGYGSGWQEVASIGSGSAVADAVFNIKAGKLTGTLKGNNQSITDLNQLIPYSDNAGSVGTDSVRWALIRGVTITAGDLGLENGWAFTEDRLHGVVLRSPKGKRYKLLMEPLS